MLDDLKYIHEKDQNDSLGILTKQADQLRLAFKIQGTARFANITNVVHAGMGGSAWPALFLKPWPLSVPFEIVRDYDIPSYVGPNTLFIADSYSGNTEETISGLEQALDRQAQVAIVAHDGQLKARALERQLPFVELPDNSQPRFGSTSNFKAIITVLIAAGLLKADDVLPQIEQTAEFVEKAMVDWLPTVPTKRNQAKQLALELAGKSIIVYSGPQLFPAAHKWKIGFNENSKQLAWSNQLPEFSHNEFIGWSEQPVDKPFAVIELRSNLEHPRVQKRFAITERLLSGKRPSPIVINVEGQTVVQQLFWAAALGDLTSIYLSLLNGLNPTPVDLVEKLKKALND